MCAIYLPQKISLLREYFFPGGCALCGSDLLDETEAWLGLCHDCAATLPLDEDPRCSLCGRPLISERKTCMSCRREAGERHYDAMVTLYPYLGGARAVLSAYKFGKHRALGHFFAEKLLAGAKRFFEDFSPRIPWVPVPPRPGKIKQAGWDQIEFIAGSLEKQKMAPLARCLKRLPSKTQKALGKRERVTNLTGKIVCAKQVPEKLILFDDVFTTGATMNACAEALKKSGAKQIMGICLFYD